MTTARIRVAAGLQSVLVMIRGILILVALTGTVFLGCNQDESGRGRILKATDYSYNALSSHDQAACPDLDGIYMPQDRMGTQFEFRKRGGYLSIWTKAAGQLSFTEIIVVSGVEIVYGNGDTAAAKCVAGQIVMQNTSAAGGRTQVNLEATPQGFSRSVWRPRNPPAVSQFFKLN